MTTAFSIAHNGLGDYINGLDLRQPHGLLAVIGIVLSLWCAQLWGRGFFGHESPEYVRVLQRFFFVTVPLSLCWSLSYSHVLHWEPWPSLVLLEFALDVYFLSIILAAASRRCITG